MKLAILRNPALEASRMVPLTAAQHSTACKGLVAGAAAACEHSSSNQHSSQGAAGAQCMASPLIVCCCECNNINQDQFAARPLDPMQLLLHAPYPMQGNPAAQLSLRQGVLLPTCHLRNQHGCILPQLCWGLAIPPLALAAQGPDDCEQRLLTLPYLPAARVCSRGWQNMLREWHMQGLGWCCT